MSEKISRKELEGHINSYCSFSLNLVLRGLRSILSNMVSGIKCFIRTGGSSMKIEKNKVVSMSYSLSNDLGQVLELRSMDNPVEFIVGHGQILPSLEEKIIGQSEGFSGRFFLKPAEAHGEYKKELVREMKSSQFPKDLPLKKGMKFESTNAEGEPLALHVIDVKDDVVLVDGNHPLAGVPLSFDIKILEIRDAAKEEIFQGKVLTDLEPPSDTKH